MNASPKNDITLIAILSVLMAFTSLSTDIYLPAMPQMSAQLHGNVEWTITGFLIGFAIAQLIWGPISDRVGRRIPLFLGLILFVIGSIGCALSNSINAIVFWRVFQALGACVGPMLSRAMIRDLYSHAEAARMLSTLMVVMAIAPIAGPLIGGQIALHGSWHFIFWLLASIGALMFIAIFRLPETLPPEKRNPDALKHAFGNYRKLLRNRPFMRYTLCVTLFYVAAYAFITGSPFVYITYFGISEQYYGWLFAVNVIGLVCLSLANRHLVNRFSLHHLLRTATLCALIGGLALAFVTKAQLGGLIAIMIAVFIFFSSNGIIAANATAAALDGVPEMAGSASALIGSLQYGSGIISSALLAWFSDGTPWTMAWIIALAVLASAATVWLPIRAQ